MINDSCISESCENIMTWTTLIPNRQLGTHTHLDALVS